ncbi:hypothetical protein ACG97_12530 [Vogesella sp. EB]|nr:hypothetical protein ACG97_12530 [Vogesella sp. EB]
MFFVAHFANGGAAVNVYTTDLARAQTQLSVDAFTSQQHGGAAGGTGNLRALAWLQLDAVDGGTNRDITDWQGITSFDRCFGTGHQLSTNLYATRGNDVATLTIRVAQQRDVGCTVWIVFDTLNLGRNRVFVTTEIDDAILFLVTTTHVTGSDVAVVVTATGRVFLLNQCGVRAAFVQVRVYHLDNSTATSRRRFYFYQSHSLSPYSAATGVAVRSIS